MARIAERFVKSQERGSAQAKVEIIHSIRLAELSRRIQAGTLDILGRAAYTATTPYAFQIGQVTFEGIPNNAGFLAKSCGARLLRQPWPELLETTGSS